MARKIFKNIASYSIPLKSYIYFRIKNDFDKMIITPTLAQ
jgi:hypothetical protein